MDRALPEQTIHRRRRRTLLLVISLLAGLALLVWAARAGLANRVDADRILTAVAELGPVESSVAATGEVAPEFEQVITSPIQADIRAVLRPVGEQVAAGEPILELDKAFALLEYQRLQQEWELKKNGLEKLRLELKKQAHELQISDSIKAIDLRRLEAELEDAKRLQRIGGGTQETVDLIESRLQIARLEKRKLEYDLSIEQQQTRTSLRELDLQSSIQAGELKAMREKLNRAEVVASRAGVLTWVNANLGTTVREGDVLARLADLRSYKIIGSCSNIHADQLRTGLPVAVQLSDTAQLSGRITTIRPTVENNIITFDIQLDQPDHPLLRPNLRLDIYIITASKPKAVRVANGPAFNGSPNQVLFVVRGDKAVRRPVEVGLSSFDFVEIEQNLQAGERVIISDMTRYEEVGEVKINGLR